MIFAHDTELALQGAAALVNTMPGTLPGEVQQEELRTVADLDRFLDTWTWTGGRTGTGAELDAVRAFRPRLRKAWEVGETDLVDLVNGFLREGDALPQLVDHDGFGWHIHATPADAPLQTRMAVEAAMAFVDILRTGERDRLKVCARDDCDDVFVDLSKNRSKRFCDATCGNRVNVAAYRARQAGTG
jgi:predicted RNA-binding Zn ribbon-like protein